MAETDVLKKFEPLHDLSIYAPEKPTIGFSPEGHAIIDDVQLDKKSTTHLIDSVGLTRKLAKSLTHATLENVCSELYPQSNLAVVKKGGTGIGLSKNKIYKNVTPEEFIDLATSTLGNLDTNRIVIGNDYSARVEVVLNKEQAVHKGDLVRSGLYFEFSPTGNREPLISAYGLRLVCTNGMTALDKHFVNTYSDDVNDTEKFRDWFKAAVRDSVDNFDTLMDLYKKLYHTEVEPSERLSLITHLIREARLDKRSARDVRAKAINESIENLWDAHNLITWATSHSMTNPDRIRRAQEYASIFTVNDKEQHQGICPICNKTHNF